LPVADWRLPIDGLMIGRLSIDGLTSARLTIDGLTSARLPIDGLTIPRLPIDGLTIPRLPIARLPMALQIAKTTAMRRLGNQQSTIHSPIANQSNPFDNRQSLDPQSPIDNPSIGNLQSAIGNR
jgi:hypothetical protein